jgi:hypothetical protein
MKINGTREAFSTILEEKNVYLRLGVDRATVSTYKKYLREGKSISIDKMEEMLKKYGATVVQEKVWELD